MINTYLTALQMHVPTIGAGTPPFAISANPIIDRITFRSNSFREAYK